MARFRVGRSAQIPIDETIDPDGRARPARMHAEVPHAPALRKPLGEAVVECSRIWPAELGEEALRVEGAGVVHVGVHGGGVDAAVSHIARRLE